MVQGLRLWVPIAGGTSSIPGQGSSTCLVAVKQKKKKKEREKEKAGEERTQSEGTGVEGRPGY